MLLPKDNHVIQTFTPDGAHQSFRKRILPRTLGRDHHFLDLQPSDPNSKILAVDLIAVPNQVAWHSVLRKGLDYLLPRPGRRRILRYVEMNQPPAMMG